MAVDKAVDSAQLDGAMTATADMLRDRTGTRALIPWDPNTGFADTLDKLLAPKLVAITVAKAPDKTIYKAGEVFDDTGMVLLAVYSDGTMTARSNYSVVQTGPLSADMTKITIAYAENSVSYNATQTIFVTRTSVAIPSQSGSLKYNGNVQSPTWLNYDQNYMILSGTTSAIPAGSYSVTFTLKDTKLYQWSDGTTAAKTISWSILASCFGVCWNYSDPSTALTRLSPDTDPNALVNTVIMREPHAAVGTGSGTSPFDAYMPWKGMEEYNIVNDAVSYKKGEADFSRTAHDTVVYIPEFYYKFVEDSANNTMYYYIADSQMTGFEKHPGSGRYVGKYHTISGYYSKSGSEPLTEVTRATARTQSRAKGSKWAQYDFATYNAIILLYLVEFADWDSQSKIGLGCGYREATGSCDSMIYHTGTSASSITTRGSVQYRNIEGLWSNVYNWVDQINLKGTRVYLGSEDPTIDGFTDDQDIIDMGVFLGSGLSYTTQGYIKKLLPQLDLPFRTWAMFPTEIGGSETTYVPDYLDVVTTSERHVAYVGGASQFAGPKSGLLYFNALYKSVYTDPSIGTRLVFIPTEV